MAILGRTWGQSGTAHHFADRHLPTPRWRERMLLHLYYHRMVPGRAWSSLAWRTISFTLKLVGGGAFKSLFVRSIDVGFLGSCATRCRNCNQPGCQYHNSSPTQATPSAHTATSVEAFRREHPVASDAYARVGCSIPRSVQYAPNSRSASLRLLLVAAASASESKLPRWSLCVACVPEHSRARCCLSSPLASGDTPLFLLRTSPALL